MIHNMVFDMGNVLIRWVPDKIIDWAFESLGLEAAPGEKEMMKRAIFDDWEWPALDHGIYTPQEGYELIKKKLPGHLHAAAECCICRWWQGPMYPLPGMAQLIKELSEKGYPIYLLSNASRDLHIYFKKIPGSEFFIGGIVSADVKLLKPVPEIYHALFDKYSLIPEECCFIDDNQLNIEAARLCGMDGIVYFGDTELLRSQLTDRGVL